MSDDILYTNLSNLVTFYMGERPSADKFNAVNKYFSRGMRELAAAIGDIYDDGFPYMSTGEGLGPAWNVSDGGNKFRGLDITSLGRIIGPASNLNARMHNSWGIEIEEITETIPAGSLEYTLLHPVKDSMISIGGFNLLGNTERFTETNQYKLLNNREILFSSEISEAKDVIYSTSSNDYHGGIDYVNAGFNVIPDPNQLERLKITYIEDRKYLIDFPKITAQQSGLAELNSSEISTENEFNNNKYYELPKWLIESILDENGNVIPENKVIPGNFMFLKNNETQEVYKDAVYEYESPSSIVVSNIDICEEPDGGYSNQKYSLILTGTNITNSIDDLRLKWFKHDHSGKFGEAPILFESIAGKFKEIPLSGIYGPSSNRWNQMPMYLHRDGYVQDNNKNNGNNAMRGDLALGLKNFSPLENLSNIMGDEGTSHKIFFGGLATSMHRAENTLQIINDVGNLYAFSSEQMSLNTNYSMLIKTKGLLDQSLNITNENSDVLIQSPKNIKITDLNDKEYIVADILNKQLRLYNSLFINELNLTESFTTGINSFDSSTDLVKYELNKKRSFETKDIDYSYFGFYLNEDRPISDTNFYTRVETPIEDGDNYVVYFVDRNQEDWYWSGENNRFIMQQKTYISASEKNAIKENSGILPEKIDRLKSIIELCNYENPNCSFEISLQRTISEEINNSGTFEHYTVLHSDYNNGNTSAQLLGEMTYNNGYTEIAINRILPLLKSNLIAGISSPDDIINKAKEIKNTFYFKINLPENYWRPYLGSNLTRRGYNHSRFLISFEYGGWINDENNVYTSSNPINANLENGRPLNYIKKVKVEFNGQVLGETEGVDGFHKSMANHLQGPNDKTKVPYIKNEFGIPVYKAGEKKELGFFEGGIFIEPHLPGEEPDYNFSESIINEYYPGRFTSNLFQANRWYKVEEKVYNNRVWLKITG